MARRVVTHSVGEYTRSFMASTSRVYLTKTAYRYLRRRVGRARITLTGTAELATISHL